MTSSWIPQQPRLLVACLALPLGGMAVSGLWSRGAMPWYHDLKKPKIVPPQLVMRALSRVVYVGLGVATYRVLMSIDVMSRHQIVPSLLLNEDDAIARAPLSQQPPMPGIKQQIHARRDELGAAVSNLPTTAAVLAPSHWNSPRVAMALYGLQTTLGLMKLPIMFGMRDLGLALVDSVVLVAFSALNTVSYYEYDGPAGVILAGYTAFCTFATWISYEMWKENTERGRQWKAYIQGEDTEADIRGPSSSTMKEALKGAAKGGVSAAARAAISKEE